MNIYEKLTEEEKKKVDVFSLKIQRERFHEPQWYKTQLVSGYILEVFKKGHSREFKELQKEMELRKKAAYERIERRREMMSNC